MKIRPVGAELLHADRQINRRAEGQTDTENLTVAFRNFCDFGRGRGGGVVLEHIGVYIAEIRRLKSY